MFPGEKDCTLALNFGGGAETEDNVPARFVHASSRYPSKVSSSANLQGVRATLAAPT